MNTRSITDVREHFADVISSVAYAKDRISLTRNGKPVAAIVPIEDLEALEELEDRIDNQLAREALEEPGPNVPWEKAKAELGLE